MVQNRTILEILWSGNPRTKFLYHVLYNALLLCPSISIDTTEYYVTPPIELGHAHHRLVEQVLSSKQRTYNRQS